MIGERIPHIAVTVNISENYTVNRRRHQPSVECALRTHTLTAAYWNMHALAFASLIGLTPWNFNIQARGVSRDVLGSDGDQFTASKCASERHQQ